MSASLKDAGKNARKKTLLYENVASRLRERIASGEYMPNAKLPSLHDLTTEFGVSTISVRRALKELSVEGLIYGEQGRGVFVTPKAVIHRVLPADSRSSTGDEIARAGFQPRFLEMKRDMVEADEDVASRLDIKPGTLLHRHEKMVFADAEPVSFHTLYFPEQIAPKLSKNLEKLFVFQLLDAAKIKVTQTRFEFGAAALTSDLVDAFGLPLGFPMGIVHLTPIAKNGKPVLTGTTIYRSDRFLYEVTAPLSSDSSRD